MKKEEYQRLMKIEGKIVKLMEEYGLRCLPVEFDVIPPQKMMEILAYRSPTNISNWKYGRDYERLRTIFDKVDAGLPYELVINDSPARAYLMNSNTLSTQVLVMAHVYAHVNFFTESRWFQKSRNDIIEVMAEANKRFNYYERLYGLDQVERIVDAGHALQWHSSPFEMETEDEKRKRIFERERKTFIPSKSEFSDVLPKDKRKKIISDVEMYNNKLWKTLMGMSPVEPTEDFLRFIIDNSQVLEDWEKDILEILRIEGQYYWPHIRTKYMNEGWATFVHERIMKVLFDEGYLDATEHGEYAYNNSLVKGTNKLSMNPYLVGSEMWKDIKERWDKGRYGTEYENCTDHNEREKWDTKEMVGEKKIQEVLKSYTDWFFMQDFLTVDLIDKLDLYIYQMVETAGSIDYVRTKHERKEVRDLIVNSFAHSGVPKVEIVDAGKSTGGGMILVHRYNNIPLDPKYTEETLKHICRLWGRPIALKTVVNDKEHIYTVTDEETAVQHSNAPTPGAKAAKLFYFRHLIDLNPVENTINIE
jgi:stage V sporulation protein R